MERHCGLTSIYRIGFDKLDISQVAGLYRNDQECVYFAGFVANGDVFTRAERMGTEKIPSLIVLRGGSAIVEYPAYMFGAAWLVHEVAVFLLAVPKPAHAAIFAMPVPLRRVDMSAAIKRRNEFITVASTPTKIPSIVQDSTGCA
jgi:hypothetical protein